MKFKGARTLRLPFGEIQVAMDQWWRTPLGRQLLEAQQQKLETFLAHTFGYHFLQLGVSQQISLHQLSPIRHKMVWAPNAHAVETDMPLVADSTALPLADDSIDVVLLHHALDFVEHPHLTLREAARVTQHKGHLVIVGFHPLSCWGICKFMHVRSRSAPWAGRFMTLSRLDDWLTLLDFQIEEIEYVLFRPPLRNPRMMQRMQWLERLGNRFDWPLGAAYIVWAKKQVGCVTPLKTRWRRQLLSGAVVGPTTKTLKRKREQSVD